jgi:phospholipid/cholesterol/gamma-HCH transport system substrate-binding protein
MDENKLRFGVGVLVISAIGIGIILTFLFGAFPNVLSEQYTLLVRFPSAQGIGLNTNVVRDGVRIGRVADIKLRREGGVLVTLEMKEKFRDSLTHRYIPQIGAGNIVSGDAKIEFVQGSALDLQKAWGENTQILDEPYSPIEETIDYGMVTPSLLEMQDDMARTFDTIREAGESIATAGGSVNELALEIQQRVNGTDDRVDRVTDEAVAALEEFQAAMRDIRSIVGDPQIKQNLETALQELPQVLQDARTTLDTAQETFDSFKRVGNAAERTVDSFARSASNIEQFTEPLGRRGEELVSQASQTLTRMDAALSQAETFGQSLNNNDGTLKRLLEDDEIYWQIRRTIENIEQASARIRPIMDDVRIFSDKIARDPRELGIKGAISRRPSGAGLK